MSELLAQFGIKIQAVEPVDIGMIPVIAQFILHIKENEEETDHADAQSEDIDERVQRVFKQAADGDFQVVPEHD